MLLQGKNRLNQFAFVAKPLDLARKCSKRPTRPAISIYLFVIAATRFCSPCTAFVLVAALSCAARIQAQDSGSLPDAPAPQLQANETPVTVRGTPLRLLKDQEAIWTSPARIRDSNALGPVALVLSTALIMTVDHQVMSSSKLQNPSLNNEATTASNGLTGGFVAAPVAMFALGEMHHDDHATETGILGGEAMVDSLCVAEVLKAISMRERPTVDNAKGKFFQTSVGADSSFPSVHSIVAWSSAAVITSEYNGPVTQILAYGLATGVSTTRVLARQHFPSDVFVGSALGWMIGRYVVRRHHYVP
jgi:membrane-associated phospholipid phosphatase